MSAEEKAHADRYIKRNKSIPEGLTALAGRYADFAKRAIVQIPKSSVQSAREIALHVADPEALYLRGAEFFADERKRAASDYPADYATGIVERLAAKADSILRSPEATGDLVASYGLTKATRGPMFQNSYLDEAAIGAKTATELLGKDYATQPKTLSEITDTETFRNEYVAAEEAARRSDRALAPLWRATDRADEMIAARIETLARQLAAALAPDP